MSSDDDNPFDLGLPMHRPPDRPRRPGKSRRRAKSPSTVVGGEPHTSGGYERDWESWLTDTVVSQPDPVAPAEPRIRRDSWDTALGSTPDNPVAPALIDRTGGHPRGSARARLRRARPRSAGTNNRSNPLLAMLIMAGIAVVVICVLLTVIHAGSHTPAAVTTPARTSPAVTTTPATDDPVAADGYPQHPAGAGTLSGTASGGTSSGPDAIFGFERGFYGARSGAQAAGFLLGGSVPADNAQGQHWQMDAAGLQRGIAHDLPAGTRYCVQITPVAGTGSPGTLRWEVQVTRQLPDAAAARTFTQIFTTTSGPGGQTLISAVHST